MLLVCAIFYVPGIQLQLTGVSCGVALLRRFETTFFWFRHFSYFLQIYYSYFECRKCTFMDSDETSSSYRYPTVIDISNCRRLQFGTYERNVLNVGGRYYCTVQMYLLRLQASRLIDSTRRFKLEENFCCPTRNKKFNHLSILVGCFVNVDKQAQYTHLYDQREVKKALIADCSPRNGFLRIYQ
jgi:hypothetical protein